LDTGKREAVKDSISVALLGELVRRGQGVVVNPAGTNPLKCPFNPGGTLAK
jgi:hypothetical protein